jgi:hypothetical protein
MFLRNQILGHGYLFSPRFALSAPIARFGMGVSRAIHFDFTGTVTECLAYSIIVKLVLRYFSIV